MEGCVCFHAGFAILYGLEITRHLKKDPVWLHPPVMNLTALETHIASAYAETKQF